MARILSYAVFMAVFLAWAIAFAEGPSAIEIVRQSDRLMRGKTSASEGELRVIRPEWERSLRFRAWSEGTEKAFIEILEPAREKGVAFLKIEGEMWNYIPRVGRVIKIPPSMMLQSWMGSDFTNDDLVKESSIVEDYGHELIGDERLALGEAWKIRLTPKPDAAVVWDKIDYWIRKDGYVPLRAEFYNERGELVRTMEYSDIREMGGRVMPARMELRTAKNPQNATVFTFIKAEFDMPVDAGIFTMQYLQKPRK